MSGPLVSVLIPTYNRAYAITRAIDSALAQAGAAVEVLVIDDGSTDGTAQLIRERYGNEARVRYLFKTNGGVSSARNLGIRECRGEFVAFLDSDDWWLPGKLALQLEGLKAAPGAGMIWTDMQAVGTDGEVKYKSYLRRMYHAYRFFPTPRDLFSHETTVRFAGEKGDQEVRLYSGEIFSQMVLGNLVHTSTVLLTRERLEKVGLFREDYKTGEDYEFHLRTCREGAVAFADAVTVSYRVEMEDRLTGPAHLVALATNFVDTFERTLEENRGRVNLPEAMLRECAASAYAWAGTACLEAGQRERARDYFLKSFRQKPWQPQLLKGLGLTTLPPAVAESLRKVLKGAGRRSSG
jgi:glycosyltransferase involved in cell wall biosynthesis